MEESKVMKGTLPETMLEAYNAAYYSCVPVLLMGAKPTPSTSKELMEKVDWTSLFNPNSKFYTAIRNALLPLNTEGRTLYLRTFIAHRLSNYSMFSKDDEKGNILCGFVLKAKNILDEQKNLSSVTDEERYIFRLYIHGRQIVENLGELASMCGVDWSAIAKEFGLVRAEEEEDEICKDVPQTKFQISSFSAEQFLELIHVEDNDLTCDDSEKKQLTKKYYINEVAKAIRTANFSLFKDKVRSKIVLRYVINLLVNKKIVSKKDQTKYRRLVKKSLGIPKSEYLVNGNLPNWFTNEHGEGEKLYSF